MSTVSSGSTGRSRDPEDRHSTTGAAADDRRTSHADEPAYDRDRTGDRDDVRGDSRRDPSTRADHSSRADTDRDDDGRTAAEREQLRTRTELELSRSRNRRWTDLGLLLLRLIPLIVILHGLSQVRNFSGFTQMAGQTQLGAMAPQVFAGLVVAAHIVLPIMIALGALTRISALLNTVALAAIWIFAHVIPQGLMDSQTGGFSGEAALLFALITIPLIFTGAGRFSVDEAAGRNKARARAERRAAKRI